MTARTRGGIALALMLIIGAGALFHSLDQRLGSRERYEERFRVMGTIAGFTFFGSPADNEEAARAARAAFEEVVRIANLYNPQSELSRLNRDAFDHPFPCSPQLWLLLEEARQAWEFSDGAFDITAKPLMDLWGFYRKRGDTLPTPEEIAAARRLVGLEKVTFDDDKQTVRFTLPGMALDLGGIAKGFAVDLAAEAVIDLGLQQGVIDLGGNLRLLPEPPPGKEFYSVGIRNPAKPDTILPGTYELRSASLSTSGNYERFVTIQGKLYGHIMNPATGEPTTATGSVTVIAPSAMLADWLSTTLFLNPSSAEKATQTFPGVSVLFSP